MLHYIAAQWTGFVLESRTSVMLQEASVQCLLCVFWQRCCQHRHDQRGSMRWCSVPVGMCNRSSTQSSSQLCLWTWAVICTNHFSRYALDREQKLQRGHHNRQKNHMKRRSWWPEANKIQGEKQSMWMRRKQDNTETSTSWTQLSRELRACSLSAFKWQCSVLDKTKDIDECKTKWHLNGGASSPGLQAECRCLLENC